MSIEVQDDVVISQYVVYFNPSDYPGKFVVRRFDILRRIPEPVPAKEPLIVTDDLERARCAVPFGLHRLPRFAGDDANILEVWI